MQYAKRSYVILDEATSILKNDHEYNIAGYAAADDFQDVAVKVESVCSHSVDKGNYSFEESVVIFLVAEDGASS